MARNVGSTILAMKACCGVGLSGGIGASFPKVGAAGVEGKIEAIICLRVSSVSFSETLAAGTEQCRVSALKTFVDPRFTGGKINTLKQQKNPGQRRLKSKVRIICLQAVSDKCGPAAGKPTRLILPGNINDWNAKRRYRQSCASQWQSKFKGIRHRGRWNEQLRMAHSIPEECRDNRKALVAGNIHQFGGMNTSGTRHLHFPVLKPSLFLSILLVLLNPLQTCLGQSLGPYKD